MVHGLTPMEHLMIQTKRTTKGKPGEAGSKARTKEPAKRGCNTKLGELEKLLRRPEGATIAQLAAALEWQRHSVRGAISGFFKKKRGLHIAAEKAVGQHTIYRIEG
jgi:hypothetical protein